MFATLLKDFSRQLSSLNDLSEVDREILKIISQLKEQPSSAEYSISPIEKDLLIDLFKKRWDKIKDTSHDYTFCYSGANQIWIDFAQKLESVLPLTYLNILIPDVKNSVDPNGLTHLSECKTLHNFYLADDDQTLCRVEPHINNCRSGKPLATYERNKLARVYPLSLKELLRIRSKTGNHLKFQYKNHPFESFWDYLRKTVIPNWSIQSICPRIPVVEIFELTQLFFSDDNKDLSRFRKKILKFADYLREYTTQEANALYGQTILVNNKKTFLVDLLLDALIEDRATLEPKMVGIAQWLFQYDPALVIHSHKVANQYKHLKLSVPFFEKSLKALFTDLVANPENERYQEEIAQIIKKLGKQDEIAQENINLISSLYRKRWLNLKDSVADYFSSPSGANAQWILIAQKLSGAGLISRNYYCFLMPTIRSEIDIVTRQNTLKFDFKDCIIDEAGKEIIYLPNCIEHLNNNGTFYIPGVHPRPFSELEIKRLGLKPNYSKYQKALIPEKVQPLSLRTILALWNLVNKSLYPIGLQLVKDYKPDQLDQAEQAFDQFFKQVYGKMDSDEKKRLDDHIIILNGTKQTFSVILDEIKFKNKCVALSCRWFAQLVLDYMPWIRFNQAIEKRAYIDEIRETSQNRLLRNEKNLILHLQTVYVSLLTYDFQTEGNKISAFGYENNIPRDVGNKLFNLLNPLFKMADFSCASEKYAEMMKIVAGASNSEMPAAESSNKAWLIAILDRQLFHENKHWFTPERLISVVSKHTRNRSTQDLLIQTFLLPSSPEVKEVIFNLHFSQVYAKMTPQDKDVVKKEVEQYQKGNFLCNLWPLIVNRLAEEASISESKLGLHGQYAINNKEKYLAIKRQFPAPPNPLNSEEELMSAIEKYLHQSDIPFTKSLQNYWFSLTRRSLIVPEEKHEALAQL